jgi:integrase
LVIVIVSARRAKRFFPDTRGLAIYADESCTNRRFYTEAKPSRNIVRRVSENPGVRSYGYTDSSGGRRKKVTPHTLRHSYAINILHPPNRMNVRTLRSHLGNSDLSVTEEYLDYIREDEKKEYQRVGGPPESEPSDVIPASGGTPL